MFDFDLNRYRLVDVSLRLVPGVEQRRLSLRRLQFSFDGSYQHELDITTHLGTHIESPAHYFSEHPGVMAIPLERCLGPMAHVRFEHLSPRAEISLDTFRRVLGSRPVRERIVLLSSPYWLRPGEGEEEAADERPYLAAEVAHYLAEQEIRMLGFNNSISIDETPELAQEVHTVLFQKGIPLLEYLGDLGQLKQPEGFLIALPLPIEAIDSSPVRAVVIEER